jgi:hypothetical protein
MTADELYAIDAPMTLERAVDIARAFLDERGDLPQGIWYELGFVLSGDARDEVWDTLSRMRAAHFKKRGVPMPPYEDDWM